MAKLYELKVEIPLSTDMDPSSVLDFALELAEDLRKLIRDHDHSVTIDEDDVAVIG